MSKKTFILLQLVVLAGTAMPQGAEFRREGNQITVSARLEQLAISTDSTGLATLSAPGWHQSDRTYGAPLLPIATQLICIPKGAEYKLETVSQSSWNKALSHKIKPSSGPNIKDREPQPVPMLDEYYGPKAAARQPVSVEELGTLGNERLLRVTVRPLLYSPCTDKIEVFSHIQATITITATNNDSIPTTHHSLYAIVAPPEFQAALQPFAQWKRQEGFEVAMLTANSSATGDIKTMLQALYNRQSPTASTLKYILLVGDIEQIDSYAGRHNLPGDNRHHTDVYYGDFTGDHLPEAMVGRISATTPDELETILAKILAFEQLNIIESGHTHRAIVIAGKEERPPAHTTTNGQVYYVGNTLARHGMDTVCYRNPESDSRRSSIINNLTNGAGIVNYTAHCYYNAWVHPTLTVVQTDTLNSLRPGIFINNCCSSNDFYATCLGEALLRKPVGGAVGVIGSSELTLWEEDYYWSVGAKYPLDTHPTFSPTLQGAFDAMTLHNATLGEMIVAGNKAVTQSGSPYDAVYWEAYNLLGDPAMHPIIGTPTRLDLSFADSVLAGTTAIAVKGTPGATATLTDSTNLLACSLVAADSSATLLLNSGLRQGQVVITVTKPNGIPAIDTLHVIPNPEGVLAVDSIALTDSTVQLTLRNIGALSATNHSIKLAQTQQDSADGCLIDTCRIALGNIEPDADTTVVLPLTLTAKDSRTLRAHLALANPAGTTYANTALGCYTSFVAPTLQMALLDAAGDTCHRLQPGSSCTVNCRIEGDCTAAHIQSSTGIDTVLTDTNASLNTIIPADARYIYIKVQLQAGRRTWNDSVWIYTGQSAEGFANGSFGAYPWQHPTLYPWHNGHDGNRPAARSGTIGNRQTSDLQISLDVLHTDSLAFAHRTSAQQGDALQFMIDGRVAATWSGNTPWQRSAYALTPGWHTLTWRYIKDESGSELDDCAWIAHVEWPLAAWRQPADTTAGAAIAAPNREADGWQLWPNPAAEMVNLTIADDCTMELRDAMGRLLDTKKMKKNSTPTQYFTQHLRCGIYVVLFRTGHTTIARKLAIAR